MDIKGVVSSVYVVIGSFESVDFLYSWSLEADPLKDPLALAMDVSVQALANIDNGSLRNKPQMYHWPPIITLIKHFNILTASSCASSREDAPKAHTVRQLQQHVLLF